MYSVLTWRPTRQCNSDSVGAVAIATVMIIVADECGHHDCIGLPLEWSETHPALNEWSESWFLSSWSGAASVYLELGQSMASTNPRYLCSFWHTKTLASRGGPFIMKVWHEKSRGTSIPISGETPYTTGGTHVIQYNSHSTGWTKSTFPGRNSRSCSLGRVSLKLSPGNSQSMRSYLFEVSPH